ncbi:MAG: response regulator [Candidatus Aureabacteria bacterium]|nr:response regulator [Candidatus Auribacterota bacterium]
MCRQKSRENLMMNNPGNVKVLIVDDQKSLVWGLEKFLDERGFFVESVSDGLEGEQKILKEDFDIVVMDLRLPGKNGLEILESVARKSRSQFILISAFATAEDAEKAAVLGARDFLPKPFEPEELLERISQILYEDKPRLLASDIRWKSLKAFKMMQVDLVYRGKSRSWIDTIGCDNDPVGIFVAHHVNDYDRGYLTALSDEVKDAQEFMSRISGEKSLINRNKLAAVIDLKDKKIFVEEQAFQGMIWKNGEFSPVTKDVRFDETSQLFLLCAEGAEEKDAVKKKLFVRSSDKDSFSRIFHFFCRIKKNEVSASFKELVVVSFMDVCDHSCIEEDFSPEFTTRDEIVHYLFSLPPSQNLSEAERNKIDLLLCEMITTLSSSFSAQDLKVSGLLEKGQLRSLTFMTQFSELLPQAQPPPDENMSLDNITDLTREQILFVLLNTLYSQNILEISQDRHTVTYHLIKS